MQARRSRTVSSQPQPRGRPVVAPNSRPRSVQVFGQAFVDGREGTGADTGGVGLADADHRSIAVGGRPVPVQEPPEVVFDEVTKG